MASRAARTRAWTESEVSQSPTITTSTGTPRSSSTSAAAAVRATLSVSSGCSSPYSQVRSSRSWRRASCCTALGSSDCRWISARVCSTESCRCAAMSARASARTLSARAWFSAVPRAVQPRREHHAETGQGQGGHGHHLGQLVDLASAGRSRCRTPRRPGPARRSPGPGPASRPGRRTAPATRDRRPRPASASAGRVSACRQTSAAPAQAKATGQKSCELMPSPLLCTIQSSPAPEGDQREQHAPVDLAPGAGLVPHALAARRLQTREATVGSGGNSSQSAPYASTPMNWKAIRATKPIRITITGQPRCRARPVQTPPSQAPSATRVARGRTVGSGAPASRASCGLTGGGRRSARPVGSRGSPPLVPRRGSSR